MGETPHNIEPLVRCQVCRKRYAPGEAILLREDGGKSTLFVQCRSCGVSSLVFVSLTPMGAVSFGALTDLGREDVERLFGREAVSAEDTLDLHRFLKGKTSDVFGHLES